MKYILLDTNIIIDMVIDRRHQVTDALLESFIKLLDFDEIKLIVPEIVKVETQRHLEEELSLVGTQIKKAKDAIDSLYGIAAYSVAGLNIKEYQNKSKAELTKAYDMYQQNEQSYKMDLHNTVNLLFTHKNSIFIPIDDFLSNAVFKRHIYKKAPFHIEAKESYGDGIITETLINLGRYVPLTPSDEIYFVTGNHKDFCVGKSNKTTLLPDITDDLAAAGILCCVKCINTFGELIGKELKDNVSNAKLSEEFERELQERYEIELIELQSNIEDMERESAGLLPMHKYSDVLEEQLSESTFANELLQIFDNISKTYRKIEDLDITLYEELNNILENTPVSDLQTLLNKFKGLFDTNDAFPHIGDAESGQFNVDDLFQVYGWIKKQETFFEKVCELSSLPDYINYGDIIYIPISTLGKIVFKIDELNLNPEEGSTEYIDVSLCSNNSVAIAVGQISITYGYIRFDEDGGASDGLADDISYSCDDILEELKSVLNDWISLYSNQEQITNYLREAFELKQI